MTQNRKKLIELLLGNISNSIVHIILEKSIDKKELTDKYRKEIINSFQIAKAYREKMNPINKSFSQEDTDHIKNKIIHRVRAELLARISKGYSNINLDSIESEVEKVLKDLNIQ